MSEKKPHGRGSIAPKREPPASKRDARRRTTTKLPAQRAVEPAPAVKRPIDLGARLADAERRLEKQAEEQRSDADFIGKLLAEIAERDRRLRDATPPRELDQKLRTAEAQVVALHEELQRAEEGYVETVVELETAQDRLHAVSEEADRVRLELSLEREARGRAERALELVAAELQATRAELEGRGEKTPRSPRSMRAPPQPQSADRAPIDYARGDFAWLLEAVTATVEEAYDAAGASADRLGDARNVFGAMKAVDRSAAEAHATLSAAIRHAENAQLLMRSVEDSAQRAGAMVVSAGRRDPEADRLDAEAHDAALDLMRGVWAIRDALAPLLPRDEDETPRKPPPAPPRRMHSRMPPAR